MDQELLLQNPWWEAKERINSDLYLQRIDRLPFTYRPQVISAAELASSGVMTLRGPRQVGKTTFLKLLIRQLLQEGVNPTGIFYYNTELLADERELFSLFQTYKEFVPPGKCIVFFDEITSVSHWEYGIKHIVDMGLGRDVLFILTGSSSVDLRRGGERLPGRRGLVQPDKILLPLSFRQYCLLRNFEEVESIDVSQWGLSLSRIIPKLKIYQSRMQSYFKDFLSHGGFLMAIADRLQGQAISPLTMETYGAVVVSDFEKLRKDRITLRNICRCLLANLSTPISWNGLAQDAGGISANTAKEYVQLLADSYLLFILEFLHKGHRKANVRKNRKLFSFDPLLYHVLARIANTRIDASFEPKIIEGVVGAALIRNTEKELFEGFSSLGTTFYWRSTRGKEVDFVWILDGQEIPIEVKYQSRISPGDYTTIKRSFGKGIVLTRDSFFQDGEVIGLPVSCFLYVLPD